LGASEKSALRRIFGLLSSQLQARQGERGDLSITLALFQTGCIPSAPQALSPEPGVRQRLFSLIALTFRVLKYLLIMMAYNLFLLFKMDRDMKTEYRQQV